MPKYADNKQNGFTIIELLVATAVFSLVLLITLAGFLQIGKVFYKGVTVTNTSQTTRNVTDTIKSEIVYAADLSNVQTSQTTRQSAGRTGIYYFCAGSNRYTYKSGVKVNLSSENIPTGQLGLVKDTVTTGCPKPFGGGSTPFTNPKELLGDKMRLSDISIISLAPSKDKLYNLTVKVAYGDDDVLTNPTSPGAACASGRNTSTYCYVYQLKTTARQGN